jgi:hypothetical protein
MLKSTTEIKRQAPSALLAGLLSESKHDSKEAAMKLIAQVKDYGLPVRDYLRLACDPRLETDEKIRNTFAAADGKSFLNGYEATLSFLNLPVKDDLDGGVMLQAAADSFEYYPGTRILFPAVVDDMVRWRYHQTSYESTEGMVGQSRTIAGAEMISLIVEDTTADYQARAIAEGGRIPIHAIKTSEQSVKFYKFGLGYKTSYEFQRRASLDILTPYAIRTQIEIEKSKVGQLTKTLINGDNVGYGAAPVLAQSTYNAKVGTNSTNGQLSVKHFAAWLASMAEAGTPVDTVVGNWDMYLTWILAFYMPQSNYNVSEAQRLATVGVNVSTGKILDFNVTFKLSTTMPSGQLLGYNVGMTVEELIEAGSDISQSEQSVLTQEVTFVRTQNSGYKLIFGDTRSIFDITA